MSANPSVKFRPSLSAQQISHIIGCLEHHANPLQSSPHNVECLKLLRVFELKAKHGIVSPSHVATGRPDIVDSLGFGELEEYKDNMKPLLDVYASNPTALSAKQLEKVQLHRYTSNLMTPEEEAEYENSTSKAT